MTTSKTFRFALLAATLVLTSITGSLHAQSANRVQVNVPFAFQNGSEVLPAGTYILSENNQFLHIQGERNSGLALSRIERTSSNPAATGKVVFQRVGDKYFLSEVWQGGSSRYVVCIPTSAEIKARKAIRAEIVASKATTPTVEIAAK